MTIMSQTVRDPAGSLPRRALALALRRPAAMAILRLYVGGDAVITRVQRWGNSQGLRLNKGLLAEAHIEVGDEVDVDLRDGALVITPLRRVRGGHDLRALVRRIPADYAPEEFDWGSPAGGEVW
jgi:antitoxin MazE